MIDFEIVFLVAMVTVGLAGVLLGRWTRDLDLTIDDRLGLTPWPRKIIGRYYYVIPERSYHALTSLASRNNEVEIRHWDRALGELSVHDPRLN